MVKGLIVLCFVLTGCVNTSKFIELEHISSLKDGKPFNDNKETSTDLLMGGYRYKSNGWTTSIAIGVETSNDLEGTNPRAKITIGKEWQSK